MNILMQGAENERIYSTYMRAAPVTHFVNFVTTYLDLLEAEMPLLCSTN